MTRITPPQNPGPTEPSEKTGGRIGLALLAYMLAVTLIITLLPFQFDRPNQWRVILTGNVVDVVANVLLFMPLGFLYRLATLHHSRHSALRVLAAGALLSMAIELAQLFEVERYSSPLDVATNAVGAWLGAYIATRLSKRLTLDHTVIGRLSLELPLMGLLYLIVPLLWLNALASGRELEHALLSLLVAVVGASILAGIQRHHLGPDRRVRASTAAVVFVAWFVAGTFPLLPLQPLVVVSGALLGATFVLVRGRKPLTRAERERRYEVPVLMSAVPAYISFLVLIAATPLFHGVGAWAVGWGFPGVASEWTKTEILRLLELVAAFTLLGYMVAEFGGRRIPQFAEAWSRVGRVALSAAVLVEGVRGFHPGHGASISRAVLLAASSVYGGWLYYLQRAHILALLDARVSARVDVAPSDEAAA